MIRLLRTISVRPIAALRLRRLMNNPCWRIGFCALLALSVWAPDVHARQKARITGTSCRFENQSFLISFRVDGAFSEDMDQAVMYGILTSFTYFFRVFRKGAFFTDEKIQEFQFVRTVRYDTIRRSFSVFLGDRGVSLNVKTLAEAKKKMTEFKDLPLVIPDATTGARYYVQIKAQMEKVELPAGIRELFNIFTSFFASLWGFETPWARIDLVGPVSGAGVMATPTPKETP